MDEYDYIDFSNAKICHVAIRHSIRKISKLEITIIQQENTGARLIKHVI